MLITTHLLAVDSYGALNGGEKAAQRIVSFVSTLCLYSEGFLISLSLGSFQCAPELYKAEVYLHDLLLTIGWASRKRKVLLCSLDLFPLL